MDEIGVTRHKKVKPGVKRSTVARAVFATNVLLALVLIALVLIPESILQVDKEALKYMFLIGIGAMALCAVWLFRLQKVMLISPNEPVAESIIAPSEQEDDSDEQLGQLEYSDGLTGLGNRKRLVERFEKMVCAMENSADDESDKETEFAVGILNLDGMKAINEMFGRIGGDAILRQCALRLANAVDGEGLVTRFGGDEFAFIFADITSESDAEEKGRILLEILQAPFDFEGRQVRISGSFGFGIVPQVGKCFEAVYENLANALYHSKRIGRGRVTVFSSDIEEQILENAKIEQALRCAIVNTKVKPHFQPIISLQDGSLLGFEALARWNDPELGFVSPGKFIPLAEERGIIAPLTETLLRQAAAAATAWPDELFLSFNLSSMQIVDPTTAGTILSIIQQVGLDPKRLEIEVTETAIMSDPQTAAKVIEDLQQAGVSISMDDFGTGQSSLGRLRELKLDKVKIDRTFIMELGEDDAAVHIVRAILEMCAGLGLKVVAEGIEKLPQAEMLKRFGCHAAQGYLFGRAQNEHRTIAYIREYMGDEALEQAKQACG